MQLDTNYEKIDEWDKIFTRHDTQTTMISQPSLRLKHRQSAEENCLDFRPNPWDFTQEYNQENLSTENNIQLKRFRSRKQLTIQKDILNFYT